MKITQPLRKKIVVLAFIVGLLTIKVFYVPTTHALKPLTTTDINQLYITEDYRDDGRERRFACSSGGSTPAGQSLSTEEVSSIIWNYFAEKGLASHQIAGIIGNALNEAGPDLRTDAINPVGGAYGIFQFADPPEKYYTYADRVTSAGLDGAEPTDAQIAEGRADLTRQLDYVWGQLTSNEEVAGRGYWEAERNVLTNLQAATTVEEAARVWGGEYERFRGKTWTDAQYEAELLERVDAAEATLITHAGDGAVGLTGQSACSNATTPQAQEENPADISLSEVRASGDAFAAAVPDGNAAEFVSFTLQQQDQPLTDGEDGWRYSSVTALQDFYQNTPGYTYQDAADGPPQVGDIIFFNNPDHTGIVSSVSTAKNTATVISVDANGNITETSVPTIPGVNGLDGYGRKATTAPSPGGGSGVGGAGISTGNCTKYVSTSGNDNNSGNAQNAAWRSPSAAVSRARAGDVVCFAPGTYTDTSGSRGALHVVGVNGSAGSPIAFKSLDPNNRAVFSKGSPAAGGGVSVIYLERSSNIVIDNLEATNGKRALTGNGVSNVSVINSYLHHTGGELVYFGKRAARLNDSNPISTNILIENNDIGHGGLNGGFGEGIYIGTSTPSSNDTTNGVVIRNNRVHDVHDEGVDVKTLAYNVSIINNHFYNLRLNSQAAITVNIHGYNRNDGSHEIIGNKITNVTRRGSEAAGIWVGHGNTVIRDNIIWNIADWGIYAPNTFNLSGSRNLSITNNTIYNTGRVSVDWGRPWNPARGSGAANVSFDASNKTGDGARGSTRITSCGVCSL